MEPGLRNVSLGSETLKKCYLLRSNVTNRKKNIDKNNNNPKAKITKVNAYKTINSQISQHMR